jgi:hypothetical protein
MLLKGKPSNSISLIFLQPYMCGCDSSSISNRSSSSNNSSWTYMADATHSAVQATATAAASEVVAVASAATVHCMCAAAKKEVTSTTISPA